MSKAGIQQFGFGSTLMSDRLLDDEKVIMLISADMLLRNKEATGRAKDLADAEELRAWLGADN